MPGVGAYLGQNNEEGHRLTTLRTTEAKLGGVEQKDRAEDVACGNGERQDWRLHYHEKRAALRMLEQRAWE